MDLIPFIDSVICFDSFGSTPVQSISNIYLIIFHIGLGAKLIFKARVFAQQFCKSAPPDRNNLITGVPNFLQPPFSFLSITNGFVSIWHVDTHAKSTRGIKRLHSSLRSTIKIHITYPSQMNFPPITSASKIVKRQTNVRWSLKIINSLPFSYTVAPSRDNTYRIQVQKYGLEHLVANWRYCNGFPKGFQLDQFQKQIPKSTSSLLSTLTSSMQ